MARSDERLRVLAWWWSRVERISDLDGRVSADEDEECSCWSLIALPGEKSSNDMYADDDAEALANDGICMAAHNSAKNSIMDESLFMVVVVNVDVVVLLFGL